MIIRFPSFYEDFSCIGGACKKSCCIGWELDVDEDTYDYYMNLSGSFGDKIREKLQTLDKEENDGSHCFCLPENSRCPFLNNSNLCDIVLNIGEEGLCDICHTYPRYSFSYGNILEKSLSISCEEVARLLFNEKDGLKFIEFEAPDGSDNEYIEDDDFYAPTPEEITNFEEYKWNLFDNLQNRNFPLLQRIDSVISIDDHPELLSREERLNILSLLEPIDGEWVDSLEKLQTNLNKESIPFKEDAYENLLIYFLFRYLPRGLYDGDYTIKIRFSLFCIFAIRDLEEIYGDVSLAASAFSREVEHSEENIDLIMEELLFL